MEFKILTGDGLEVIQSGTIISFNKSEIKFELATDFNFIVRFIESSQGVFYNEVIHFELPNKTTLVMNLTITNVLSRPIAGLEPVLIGDLDGKDVFFNFSLSNIPNTDNKILYYTFYLKTN